jgi:hypothetical protein
LPIGNAAVKTAPIASADFPTHIMVGIADAAAKLSS